MKRISNWYWCILLSEAGYHPCDAMGCCARHIINKEELIIMIMIDKIEFHFIPITTAEKHMTLRARVNSMFSNEYLDKISEDKVSIDTTIVSGDITSWKNLKMINLQ